MVRNNSLYRRGDRVAGRGTEVSCNSGKMEKGLKGSDSFSYRG